MERRARSTLVLCCSRKECSGSRATPLIKRPWPEIEINKLQLEETKFVASCCWLLSYLAGVCVALAYLIDVSYVYNEGKYPNLYFCWMILPFIFDNKTHCCVLTTPTPLSLSSSAFFKTSQVCIQGTPCGGNKL